MTAVLGWIGKGLYAAATFAGYGFRISEEAKDANVANLVRGALSSCTSSSCCITGWRAVTDNLRPLPELSLATSAIVPIATFGTGALLAHTLSKHCTINICKRQAKPTCCQKVAAIARGVLGVTAVALYPWATYFEQTDVTFISRVAEVFKQCTGANITKCCLSNWEQIVPLQHNAPDLALISAIALPAFTLFLGVIAYQDILLCCKTKTRVDRMPGSATYDPVSTGDDI